LFCFILHWGGCYVTFFVSAFESKILPIRGNIRRGLCCQPWQSAACSGTIFLLATSWLTPCMLGLFYVVLGVAWGTKTQVKEK
jgi:hypothetical protein